MIVHQFFFPILVILNFASADIIGSLYQCPYSKLISEAQGTPLATTTNGVIESIFSNYNNYINKEYNDPFLLSNVSSLRESDTLQCSIPSQNCYIGSGSYSYRSYDGSCNNIQHPEYGMALSRYSRLLRPRYGDNVYSPALTSKGFPLPNARRISLSLYGEDTFEDEDRTLALQQFGQFVAHDIAQLTTKGAPADCCKNVDDKMCYPIFIPTYGPIHQGNGKNCLHFARAISDVDAICSASGHEYAEKITKATAYLDLSSIYGNSNGENQKIRLNSDGLLKMSISNNRHMLPTSPNSNGKCGEGNYKCYDIPDMRNQFTPHIAVVHTLLQREHNRLAYELKKYNPGYTDERLFQEARKINIAQYQKIIYYDWLPHILGTQNMFENQLIHNSYVYGNDYDSTINPGPYAEWATAAFRYAHNQIPGWFTLVSSTRAYNSTIRLSDYFDRPETLDLLAENFDGLLLGLATQHQKRPDSNIDKELKHYFDRKNYEEYGTDLKSIDIQRGRDFGLPSYNDLREFCGLPRAYNFADFSDFISPHIISLLEKLYDSPDDVELSVGGSVESHLPNSLFGPTFHCIVTRQFLNTRRGDRFFFENSYHHSGLNRAQKAEIHKVTLAGLFCINSDNLEYIQKNVFTKPDEKNLIQHCSSFPQIDLSKWAGY